MSILVSRSIGFCHGVERAVELTRQALVESGNVHISGDLVHNRLVCETLKREGLVVHPEKEIPKLVNNDSVVLIRAHGVDLTTERELESRFSRVLDLTCPIVRSVFELAEKLNDKGYRIVVLGKNHHPEIVALSSRVDDPLVIEDGRDLARVLNILGEYDGRIALLSQTTMSSEKHTRIFSRLRAQLGERVHSFSTICEETLEREAETKHLASQTDLVIVVGSPDSSNARKLVDVAESVGTSAILVDEASELAGVILPERVGVISGTSTPMRQVQQILDNIEKVPRR